jgi:hypothetical protein
VPVDPNALALYQQDVLAALRALLGEVEALDLAIQDVLVARAREFDAVGQVGHELAMLAYDDDGDLLNPLAEEMVDAIDNGIVPDLADAREGVLEPLRALATQLRESVATVEGIEVPPDAMTRVMTPSRLEEAAADPPPSRRSRRRFTGKS